VAEIDIGMGKSGRRAYGFDDITIVPSRRTRDPEDIDLSWEIDAYRFDLPFMASAMDSVVSPATAIEIGRLGGVGVLNLEGLWTRYEDADAVLEEIATLDEPTAMARMQELYAAPVDSDLVVQRIREINDADVVSCAAISPQRTADHIETILKAELGLLVIQQPVISAEHVSKNETEPLNLKTFIRRLEVPVIVAKAIVCGADAVMLGAPLAAASEAPGKGWHWGVQSVHPTVPQGGRVAVPVRGTLDEILHGPSHADDGALNLAGSLRQSMAMCGYTDLKDFQKAEILVQQS